MFTAKVIKLRYIKGNSDVFSGVKEKDAKKFEGKNNVYGGNGTYRINNPSILELLVNIEGEAHYVDIKNFIRDEFNFQKFSKKRIQILKDNLPEKVDLIKSENDLFYLEIDRNSKKTEEWIKKLKELF